MIPACVYICVCVREGRLSVSNQLVEMDTMLAWVILDDTEQSIAVEVQKGKSMA